ncbi:zinc-dependent alcohol dehydrogenase family protein [Moorella naiadis]|uniref:zinc-dependent alcohol dehydrogenase family protein n=1 Tax=Moorella naiadis (nom. illeg.) TaxID=3093670 RepID=UPI003D9C9136
MLAAVYTGKSALEIKEIPLRKLNPDEVLLKVETATICGTDLHILDGEYPTNPPMVPGHEFAGYIEEVGEAVSSFKPGELVTVEPHIFCGLCKFCRIGKVHLCLDKKAFGVHLNGGFAQYAILPQHTIYRVPPHVSPEEAALAENIGCCLHGIDRAGIQVGDTVVILGGGVVGIILTQLAKLRGAGKVIVIEPIEKRRLVALKRGADVVIDPLHEHVHEIVMDLTNGLGADVVIEAAGRVDTAKHTIDLVSRCGTILFFGVVAPGQIISIEPNEIYRKELTIVGSAINPFTHHRVLEILPSLKAKELITHKFPLSGIEEAFSVARRGLGLKVCITPNA